MGKFLSPEDQMRMLNERAKHSQKFEDDSNDKSFRDLATKSHKKNKKKKKNTAENESSVKYFNPFDGLFTNSEQEYSKSNITEMFEQKEDTVTDETEEFTDGMIQGKEEDTELRNVFVCIMEELKRIVIDDGIAPKSFYFDSELIDVDNRLTDKDIEKSAEIIEKLTDYIISISHPTAVFKEEDILKAPDKFKYVGDLYDKSKFRLFEYRTSHTDEECNVVEDDMYIAAYKIDNASFSELTKLVTYLTRASNNPEAEMLLAYIAIASCCEASCNEFLMEDQEQLDDFYDSSFNNKDEFINEFINDQATGISDSSNDKDMMYDIDTDDVVNVHMYANVFFSRVLQYDSDVSIKINSDSDIEYRKDEVLHATWDPDEENEEETSADVTITEETNEVTLMTDDMVMVDTPTDTTVEVDVENDGSYIVDRKGIDKVTSKDESLIVDVVRGNK